MFKTRPGRWQTVLACTSAAVAMVVIGVTSAGSVAAKGGGACDDGGFRIVNTTTGAVIATGRDGTSVPASAFAPSGRIGVRGRYNQFDVRLDDFATLDWAFTGVASPKDITGGTFTPVFASKVPDLRGGQLTGNITISADKETVDLSRAGTGVSMKIQASDCGQGGVFQMEPQRSDGARTRITHTLAQNQRDLTPFYFDNPNFRAHVGEFLGSTCTSVQTGPPGQFCVRVATRVNIANSHSPNFVARDSAQVATRVPQADCNTVTPLTPSAAHCGSVAIWDVASGGRMGLVTGEDSTEVANPPTNCTQNCQAQNRVRGRLTDLGFPFPVPNGSRFTPAQSSLPLPPLTAP